MKKTRNVTIAALAAVTWLCAGCDFGSMNGATNRQAVAQKYNAEVWNLPDKKYAFIARKPDGSVWYVETYGTGETLISAETQLFTATK